MESDRRWIDEDVITTLAESLVASAISGLPKDATDSGVVMVNTSNFASPGTMRIDRRHFSIATLALTWVMLFSPVSAGVDVGHVVLTGVRHTR